MKTSLILLLFLLPGLAEAQDSAKSSGDSTTARAAWTVSENPDLKGESGRLLVTVPVPGASMIFHILKPGSEERIDTWYDSGSAGFYPGTYDVKVWEMLVRGVPIEKGKDTRVHVGALSLSVDGIYSVHDESGRQVFNGIGSEKPIVVLPAGSYRLTVPNGSHTLEIEDGKVTEF